MTKYTKHIHWLLLFTIAYFTFGLFFPVKMAYANNIAVSYIHVVVMYVSNLFIEFVLFIRNLT